ncbi:MAG: ERF family protein [Acidaminococcus sp.]|uniref:ERF family protein n=1 Tax=Acidaminococcus sp. TaxID=1872103 RepID=UPI002A74ACA0|nr:ERF family protein [Acidaminococcus sp.]MDY2738925.1 ERF family protein [Acidaminococcus sp.]
MTEDKKGLPIEEMGRFERLTKLQNELAVPKNQYNKFGDFHYRSAEDILASAKPLLDKYRFNLTLVTSPCMKDGWHYMRCVAVLTDYKTEKKIVTNGFARENESRPKMDAAQCTGTSESYAKKYALGNLFLLDDIKDPDAYEHDRREQKSMSERVNKTISKSQETKLLNTFSEIERLIPTKKAMERIEKMKECFKIKALSEMTEEQWQSVTNGLNKQLAKARENG